MRHAILSEAMDAPLRADCISICRTGHDEIEFLIEGVRIDSNIIVTHHTHDAGNRSNYSSKKTRFFLLFVIITLFIWKNSLYIKFTVSYFSLKFFFNEECLL